MTLAVRPTIENDFYPSLEALKATINSDITPANRNMAYVVLADDLAGISSPNRYKHPWLVIQFDPDDEFCMFINRTTTEKSFKVSAPERLGSLSHDHVGRADWHRCSTIDANGWFYFKYISSRADLYRVHLDELMRQGGRRFNDRIKVIAHDGEFCSNESKDARQQILTCIQLTLKRLGENIV
jgi:hypothetical protein